VYGTQTLDEINDLIAAAARVLRIDVEFVQQNGEGAIVDAIHGARKSYDAIVINPGAYAHYSYAIADAIASVTIPVIEVHLSNIASREIHRRTSVTASVSRGSITGFGPKSYILALHALVGEEQ
jgi:3-dehydroquinate dehydratase II